MIAERTLAQAAHAWGAQGIPFNDEPKKRIPSGLLVLNSRDPV